MSSGDGQTQLVVDSQQKLMIEFLKVMALAHEVVTDENQDESAIPNY
jgi:hypothetical protein